MASPSPRAILLPLLAAVALAACSSASGSHVHNTPAPQPAPPQGPIDYVAKARADSVRYPYTEADVHFMTGMISHHAQAIVMARMAPTHGASPAVRVLSDRIINAQADEIKLMQTWLRDRLKPVPDANATGMKMVMGGVEHTMLMPGMLSEEQLRELDAARGREFDRLFLVFMIQHHKGAVDMVQQLFDTYGAGIDNQVWKFASDVNIDQTTEITRMEQMLVALLTSPQ